MGQMLLRLLLEISRLVDGARVLYRIRVWSHAVWGCHDGIRHFYDDLLGILMKSIFMHLIYYQQSHLKHNLFSPKSDERQSNREIVEWRGKKSKTFDSKKLKIMIMKQNASNIAQNRSKMIKNRRNQGANPMIE